LQRHYEESNCLFISGSLLRFHHVTWWQVNDVDSRLGQTAHENGITTSDDEPGRELNTDILADKPLNRTPKHLNVTGKRNLPASQLYSAFFQKHSFLLNRRVA
jgi:hypothetical protein